MRKNLVQVFASAGTEVWRDDQKYLWQRLDTIPAGNVIAVWATHCRSCGAPIEVFAAPGKTSFSRNCKLHARRKAKLKQPSSRATANSLTN